MENKVIEIATQILEKNQGEVTIHTNMANTDNWDSLRHLNLILEIEDHFNIRMDIDEINDITDIKTLVSIVCKYKG
jgi:acyl carrier protein